MNGGSRYSQGRKTLDEGGRTDEAGGDPRNGAVQSFGNKYVYGRDVQGYAYLVQDRREYVVRTIVERRTFGSVAQPEATQDTCFQGCFGRFHNWFDSRPTPILHPSGHAGILPLLGASNRVSSKSYDGFCLGLDVAILVSCTHGLQNFFQVDVRNLHRLTWRLQRPMRLPRPAKLTARSSCLKTAAFLPKYLSTRLRFVPQCTLDSGKYAPHRRPVFRA